MMYKFTAKYKTTVIYILQICPWLFTRQVRIATYKATTPAIEKASSDLV